MRHESSIFDQAFKPPFVTPYLLNLSSISLDFSSMFFGQDLGTF
jgi:hypothetical protein